MINKERFWQKKWSTRTHFGRKIDQWGKNSAEKLINEDFQLFCYGIPRWSVFLPNSFLVDRFFCRNVSSLIIFSAKIFPRWSLFLPKSFLIDHFFVTTSTRILTFSSFWGLKTPSKKFLAIVMWLAENDLQYIKFYLTTGGSL